MVCQEFVITVVVVQKSLSGYVHCPYDGQRWDDEHFLSVHDIYVICLGASGDWYVIGAHSSSLVHS